MQTTNANRMRSTDKPVPPHVAAATELQRQRWNQAQGYYPGAKTVSANLDCGNVKPFSNALYEEFPAMVDRTRVISAAGKVRVTTTADVDVADVKAFICEYADLLANYWREVQENHATFMSTQHLRGRYEAAVTRRQRSVQRQAQKLRMK